MLGKSQRNNSWIKLQLKNPFNSLPAFPYIQALSSYRDRTAFNLHPCIRGSSVGPHGDWIDMLLAEYTVVTLGCLLNREQIIADNVSVTLIDTKIFLSIHIVEFFQQTPIARIVGGYKVVVYIWIQIASRTAIMFPRGLTCGRFISEYWASWTFR